MLTREESLKIYAGLRSAISKVTDDTMAYEKSTVFFTKLRDEYQAKLRGLRLMLDAIHRVIYETWPDAIDKPDAPIPF